MQLEKNTTATPFEPYDYKGKWYLRKETGKKVLNGTETWSVSSTNTSGYNRFTCSAIYNAIKKPSATSIVADTYSNYFIKKSADNTYARINGISIGTNGNIYIYDDDFKEYTAEQFKTWLNSHNTEVYYVLETPTNTEITDTTLIGQLEVVKLLSGTQNNFTIDADTLPTLNLNYIGEANPHL